MKTIPLYDREPFAKEFSARVISCQEELNGEKKLYKVQYRLILDGVPKAVNARIALVQEADGEKLIVGINYISEEDQISHE